MKKIILLLILSLSFTACSNTSKDKDINKEVKENKITDNKAEKNEIKEKENNKTSDEKDKKSDNKKDKKSEDSKEKKDTEPEKNVTNNKIDINTKLKIDKSFPVYSNSTDAINSVNKTNEYSAGEYFIYKIVDNSINVTKTKGSAGGWVNLKDININKEDLILDNSNQSENKKDEKDSSNNNANKSSEYLGLSTESKSWSWGYPDNSDYIKKYSAIYNLSTPNTIYLTFDNGYEFNNNSNKILDILKEQGVKAAFFTTSHFISENPEVTRRMVNEGHLVANHTKNHLHQGEISAQEIINDIKGWETTFEEVVGSNPTAHYMRPPAGSYSEMSLKIAKDLGYNATFWAYAYHDWDTDNQPEVSSSLQKLLTQNKSGNIILLHAISDTNVSLLRDYIIQTKASGFTFKLLP